MAFTAYFAYAGAYLKYGDGDETTDEDTITFYGSSLDHLTMKDFSLTADRIFSTQGTVVSVAQGKVVIQLDEGYPGIDELFETETTEANKMRLIDDGNPDDPNFVLGPDDDLYYYRWSWQGSETGFGPENLGNGEWKFFLVRDEVPPNKVGDRMAISSKCGQSNWGMFDGGELGGTDLVFENIELTRLGRIKFRRGWNGIRFNNVSIARRKWQGITAFYSTDAGPQLGHDEDEVPLKNVIMENCSFVGTTDDATAAQRVISGGFSNNYWEDGGGVLMGEHVGCDVEVYDNEHNCCPLEDFAGCGFDTGNEHCDGPTLEDRG